ncbi:MAG: dockerin type I repeat-containing protein [Candidatus Latescibacterota bacterium]
MAVTATVQARGRSPGAGGHLLAAFAGTEGAVTCRGVASPVAGLNNWHYFLTVYGNAAGEEVTLAFYDAGTGRVMPVQEHLELVPNATVGTPAAPLSLLAGYVRVEIGADQVARMTPVDATWSGEETVEFVVRDQGTLRFQADSVQVRLTVVNNHQPIVSGIADQVIEVGGSFARFDLDDHVVELDGDPVSWSTAGNQYLRVSIGRSGEVTITPLNPAWTGSESIVFRATDLFSVLLQTLGEGNAFSSSDTVVFTITPLDHAPVLGPVPAQTIGVGGAFAPLDLTQYLAELDGQEVSWEYCFPPPAVPEAQPEWTPDAAGFEQNMSLAAAVRSLGEARSGSGHRLGAFADGECRGVAAPVKALGTWVYFLVIYGDSPGQAVSLRFYDALVGQSLPVAPGVTVQANAALGTPQAPLELEAGILRVHLSAAGLATVEPVDSTWFGTQTVRFTARDQGTGRGLAATRDVSFTVLPDHAPRVAGIPDLAVEQGTGFPTFDLAPYLEELDGDPVDWHVAGAQALQVTVDPDQRVTVIAPGPGWVGSEEVRFVATDSTPSRLSGAASARFSVRPVDHAPVLAGIPPQSVRQGPTFPSLLVAPYLTEVDGDPVAWSLGLPALQPLPGPPAWSVSAAGFPASMSLTAAVSLPSGPAEGAGHLLAAFAQDECRGVASPTPGLADYLYFLTVYGRSDGEEIGLRFYDAQSGRVLPLAERLTFTANAVTGTPAAPRALIAGPLAYRLEDGDRLLAQVLDPSWTGSDTVLLVAADATLRARSDSVAAVFTVLPYQTVYGDVSGPERVNAFDAAQVLQHLVLAITLTGLDSVAADVSGNADISAFDAALILQHSVGRLARFPVEQGAPAGPWPSRSAGPGWRSPRTCPAGGSANARESARGTGWWPRSWSSPGKVGPQRMGCAWWPAAPAACWPGGPRSAACAWPGRPPPGRRPAGC